MSDAPRERIYTFFVVKQSNEPDRVVVWDTQDVTVGRSPDNDLAIDHSELSRHHVVFTRLGAASVVRNMSTSNGTCVNGRPVEQHTLAAGDVVQMADIELHFYEDARNPVTMGTKLVYTSQLKAFPDGPEISSPDSTMLGLMGPVEDGQGEDFEGRSAPDFTHELHRMDDRGAGPAPRNLDLELRALQMAARDEAWSLDEDRAKADPARSGPLSLRLEIEGLEGDLRRLLESLRGRTVALQGLRIRIADTDEG